MDGNVAIVGAGVAGLAAARRLVDGGLGVRIVDKGRSVGGRLATRRIGGATLDHGAQFFTVRSEQFAATTLRAEEEGIVHEWCRGFDTTDTGHPRYAAHGGMNRFGKYLAAGLDVAVDTRIESVATRAGRWELRHAGGRIEADALLLTAPVPQSLALLDAGGAVIDGAVRARLDAVDYHPTLALMVVLEGASSVPDPGAAQLTEGPFRFVADNRVKGISAEPALTFSAAHDVSAARWDDDDDTVRAELLEHARPWLGEAAVVDVQLKRWRYAEPKTPADHHLEATDVDGAPLAFAGDAFAGAKVEGAFLSGQAAAAHLESALSGGLP